MKKIIFFLMLFFLFLPLITKAETLNQRLAGKVLLQVEKNGEAWYLNPNNSKRYFLGRPADAFNIMRELGLGIKHDLLQSYLDNQFPENLRGKILLDVEKNGEAYYVNPEDSKGHYLGRPADAFRVMRELGLGISNENLDKISLLSRNTTLELIDDTWNLYTNKYFGFSIKLPQKAPIWLNSADVIVNEYENRIEIMSNNKTIWTLYASWVENDEGLEKFIQKNYGNACKTGSMQATGQADIYSVLIDEQGRSEDCFVNYLTKTFYNSVNNLAITWALGQDISFFINNKALDSEIVDSFKFID